MDHVSCVCCVSCVSWYWVDVAETHETFHSESGMRYQVSSTLSIRAQIDRTSGLPENSSTLIRTLTAPFIADLGSPRNS